MAWLSGPCTVPIGTSANPVTWCKLKPVGPLGLHIVVVIVEPQFVNGVMSSTVISCKWWRRCWFCLWQQLLRTGRQKPLQEQEEIKVMCSEETVKDYLWLYVHWKKQEFAGFLGFLPLVSVLFIIFPLLKIKTAFFFSPFSSNSTTISNFILGNSLVMQFDICSLF